MVNLSSSWFTNVTGFFYLCHSVGRRTGGKLLRNMPSCYAWIIIWIKFTNFHPPPYLERCMKNKWLFLVKATATQSRISILLWEDLQCQSHLLYAITASSWAFTAASPLQFSIFEFLVCLTAQIIWKVKNDQTELKCHFVMLNIWLKRAGPSLVFMRGYFLSQVF